MLDAVDQAYQQFDNDRSMLERSLDLSSQELLQANGELRALVSAFPDHILRLDPRGIDPRHQGRAVANSRGAGWPATIFSTRSIRGAVRPAARSPCTGSSPSTPPVNIELEPGADIATPRFYEARLLPLEDTPGADDPARRHRASLRGEAAAGQPAWRCTKRTATSNAASKSAPRRSAAPTTSCGARWPTARRPNRRAASSKSSCATRRRWRRSAGCPAASRTTSTTC